MEVCGDQINNCPVLRRYVPTLMHPSGYVLPLQTGGSGVYVKEFHFGFIWSCDILPVLLRIYQKVLAIFSQAWTFSGSTRGTIEGLEDSNPCHCTVLPMETSLWVIDYFLPCSFGLIIRIEEVLYKDGSWGTEFFLHVGATVTTHFLHHHVN